MRTKGLALDVVVGPSGTRDQSSPRVGAKGVNGELVSARHELPTRRRELTLAGTWRRTCWHEKRGYDVRDVRTDDDRMQIRFKSSTCSFELPCIAHIHPPAVRCAVIHRTLIHSIYRLLPLALVLSVWST